jgi:hypothetical protein
MKKCKEIENALTGSGKAMLISYRYRTKMCPEPETGEQVPTVFFIGVLILCVRKNNYTDTGKHLQRLAVSEA